MGAKDRVTLTEPMFYVLMSFLKRDMCGTEITEFVDQKTRGRVKLGPAPSTPCWPSSRTRA